MLPESLGSGVWSWQGERGEESLPNARGSMTMGTRGAGGPEGVKWVTMLLLPHAARATQHHPRPSDRLILNCHAWGRFRPPTEGIATEVGCEH